VGRIGEAKLLRGVRPAPSIRSIVTGLGGA
jgi:hypothetical protein